MSQQELQQYKFIATRWNKQFRVFLIVQWGGGGAEIPGIGAMLYLLSLYSSLVSVSPGTPAALWGLSTARPDGVNRQDMVMMYIVSWYTYN